MPIALAFEAVSKSYRREDAAPVDVLRDLTFAIDAGTTTAVIGRSGSGKSTLLHLAAGIDVPSAGRVLLFGDDLGAARDRERTRIRRDRVGLVFQFFHLLPHLSVLDNVLLPERIAAGENDATPRALALIERVGLIDRARDPVDGLSGGEQQRVALCRALLKRPALLLADEPTGNLDDANGRVVMDLLFELAREQGATLVYVTHSRELAARAGRRLELKSGVLVAT